MVDAEEKRLAKQKAEKEAAAAKQPKGEGKATPAPAS